MWHSHSKLEVKKDRLHNNGPPAAGPDHRLRVYDDVTQLIASPENPTPLVRLNAVNSNKAFQIYLKLERYNPFGSIKDRIAYQMLMALSRGDRTVVEP
ncbi:MAG: pyridoxal-phosphate dependent enzyme, partial [Dehalococcoidales bacterium]